MNAIAKTLSGLGPAGLIVLLGILAMFVCAAMPAMAQVGRNLKDAALRITRALPNGANTVYSSSIDTGTSADGNQPSATEWLLTYPALTTTQLPDTRTMTYSILVSDSADLSSGATVIYPSVVVQTGAGGAGAAGGTFRFALPSGAGRYVGAKAVGGASAGDCTGANLTIEPVF